MIFQKKFYDNNTLLKLYKGILKPRMIEEKMLILLRQGKVSKWFSGIGQEAISAGATLALDKDEYILPLHRNLAYLSTAIFRLLNSWLNGRENTAVSVKGANVLFTLAPTNTILWA